MRRIKAMAAETKSTRFLPPSVNPPNHCRSSQRKGFPKAVCRKANFDNALNSFNLSFVILNSDVDFYNREREREKEEVKGFSRGENEIGKFYKKKNSAKVVHLSRRQLKLEAKLS